MTNYYKDPTYRIRHAHHGYGWDVSLAGDDLGVEVAFVEGGGERRSFLIDTDALGLFAEALQDARRVIEEQREEDA